MSEKKEIEKKEQSQVAGTEHYQSARYVVEKMHGPKDMHDKQIHTNIPKPILVNVLSMTSIEHGLRRLTDSDSVLIDYAKGKVTLYRDMKTIKPDVNGDGADAALEPISPTGQPVSQQDLIPYRTISLKAWYRSKFYADAMAGFSGNLLEELMSVPVASGEGGWRSEQAVKEVSALTNSERMLIEAQNRNKPGILSRIRDKVSSAI